MDMLSIMILIPLAVAFVLLILKHDRLRNIVVIVSAVVIAILSVIISATHIGSETVFFEGNMPNMSMFMMATEVMLCVVISYLGIKYKKYAATVLILVQTPLVLWFELSTGHNISVANNLYIDGLSIVMILIVGIIGSLIAVYSIGYMRDYRKHDESEKDRRPWFFFLIFVFLSAMFGIVVSNNLLWMFFFWEITTLCSFFLIGFTKTEEAVRNSFRQLIMNLIGGLAFAAAVILIGTEHGTLELNVLIDMGLSGTDVTLPVTLLVFAGIVKAAQMPFHSWLLGAMVAPTPTSALLHSSTMVKAGVFVVLKMSPLLGANVPGTMAMTVGAVTFLLASMAAISQSNAKRVLAYSTVANLGLIICCGGIGTYEAVWAGIMLMIFHSVTKSLLFLCVGTAEHHIGSRDIEDMDGLFDRMPNLAAFMMIGIASMFLMPFGMLVSKWAALTAFVNTENIILIACICFGSAVTIFYWTKWMGKLSAVIAGRKNIEKTVNREEWGVLGTLTAMTVILCFAFPLVSQELISPYLSSAFGIPLGPITAVFGDFNAFVMLGMLALLLIVFLSFFNRSKDRIDDLYMCGVNTGDNLSYKGSMGEEVNVTLRNWYMEDWFGEDRMNKIGLAVTIFVIVLLFAFAVTGVTL